VSNIRIAAERLEAARVGRLAPDKVATASISRTNRRDVMTFLLHSPLNGGLRKIKSRPMRRRVHPK
jgi:hypothetical protein